MPRTFAHFKTEIWNDDDFRMLPSAAQHLYVVLWTSAGLSYCGVTDWRPPRLARTASDLTAGQVVEAGLILHRRLYVVVDEDTEEVLVRSFIRNDGLMEQPNVAAAMVRDYGTIASSAIRGVVVHELQRLFEEKPELKGWRDAKTGKERGSLLLGNPSVNPSVNPSGWGSVNPSEIEAEGPNRPLPVTHASLPSPSPTPAPRSNSPSGRRKPVKPIPDDWQPNEKHAALAAQLELDLATEVDKFRDYDKSKGPIWKEHDPAFNNWLRNNAKWGNSPKNPYSKQAETDGLFDRAMNRSAGNHLEIA